MHLCTPLALLSAPCLRALGPQRGSTLEATEEITNKEVVVCNVSKTALLGLSRTLSRELAPKGIRVNCLVPGIIETDFSQMLHKSETFWNHYKETMLVQRIGQPEDCAGLVSFLCSPDASYITGENIAVAGYSTRL